MKYLTAIGLTPGTVHIYTQTTRRTTQLTHTIHRTTQLTNLIFVFPCIIIYGFIRTSLMHIV